MVWVRRRGRVCQGPAAAKRATRRRKRAASGQAVGSEMRMRAAPSTTRAAILISRSLRVENSQRYRAEHLGTALRTASISQ